MTKWPPIPVGSGFFLTAYTPRSFPLTTASFSHGYQVPTTEPPGSCALLTERGYRGRESCQGTLECYTSQGRLWYRRRHSHDDQSEFSPSLC